MGHRPRPTPCCCGSSRCPTTSGRARAPGRRRPHRRRRGRRDRRARRRQPVLHRRDDRHAAPGRRRRDLRRRARASRPPCRRWWRRASTHSRPRLRDLARRASVVLRTPSTWPSSAPIDPEATPDEIRRARGGRDPRARGRQRGPGALARPPRDADARSRTRACPSASALRLHELIADRLFGDGPPLVGGRPPRARRVRVARPRPATTERVAERAADALLDAGDRARRRMESRTAIDHYERALAMAGPEDAWGVREARALAGIGEARYWLGEYPAARDVLERAVELGREARRRVHALARAAVPRRHRDQRRRRPRQGRGAARPSRSRRPSSSTSPWAFVRTLLFAGWVPWTRGDYDAAETIWRRALEVAEPEDGWARVRALTSLSINRTGSDRIEPDPRRRSGGARADRRGARARRGDRRPVQHRDDHGAAGRGSWTTRASSRSRSPASTARSPTFEDLGARWELGDATAERGIAKRELGRLDEAEEDLRKAIRISEELGERQLASWTWRALARVSERRGDEAEAEQRLRRSREAEARGPR